MSIRHTLSTALMLALLGTSACMGGLAKSDNTSDGGGTNRTSSDGNSKSSATEKNHLPQLSACENNSDTPAPRQLRRLTPKELNATLQTLFADPNAPQASGIFDNDPEVYSFHNVASALLVSGVSASQVQTVAEAAGAYAATNAAKLSPTCQTTDSNCETAFINSFGTQAFRAPLAASDVQSYLTLMQDANDFPTAVGTVVDAMIQSPHFLYRSEVGTASNGKFTLTPYEVASELSYLIVGSMPDATLMQAAANGNILDAKFRATQVTRLMQDPRAHNTLDEFFLEWLTVADLPTDSRSQNGNTMSPATASDMLTETKTTIDNLLFAQNANFSSLHTLSTTYINSELAQFYGLNGASGDANTFVAVPLAGQRDTGILNQGGVIAAASEVNMPSPVLRGRMLREHILCGTIGAPPAGVPVVNGVAANSTTRATFVAHVTDPTCSACHSLMDPMAFPQGAYDTLGRAFPGKMENGQTIDTTGTINGADGGTAVSLSNATDLSNYVAQSPQAMACMARNWAMYGLGNVDWAQDGCTYDAVSKAAAASGYNLQATLNALTQVTSFTQRVQDN